MGTESWTKRLNNSHFGFFFQFFSPCPALLLPISQCLGHSNFSPLSHQGLTLRALGCVCAGKCSSARLSCFREQLGCRMLSTAGWRERPGYHADAGGARRSAGAQSTPHFPSEIRRKKNPPSCEKFLLFSTAMEGEGDRSRNHPW